MHRNLPVRDEMVLRNIASNYQTQV